MRTYSSSGGTDKGQDIPWPANGSVQVRLDKLDNETCLGAVLPCGKLELRFCANRANPALTDSHAKPSVSWSAVMSGYLHQMSRLGSLVI
ncbi:hypothetical protein DM791_07430 [Paenarthrobacter nitroguajacolicus]|nr:hypothetical protein [Paenarthrobacter nitroguajacolicus]